MPGTFIARRRQRTIFAAKRASAALGREVRIDENFDIDWSPTPKIRAGGIHLANTGWAGGGDMADVGAVEGRPAEPDHRRP
ncbi:MAG TPA: hypothetical protein VEX87_18115 [Skermanella sp.]|jgi:hypothetical protein|nr:hypothetical protein [Skermanella sp.]